MNKRTGSPTMIDCKAGILSDVVALVVCTAQGSVDDKKALTRKLESLGAVVNARFGKGVTHVVCRRSIPHASPGQKQNDDEELRGLYAKAEKAMQSGGVPATFVEPFWIEACVKEQQRVPEDAFLISCPPCPIFDLTKALTPGSTARKKRKKRMQQPRPAGAYELDMAAMDFSSTQQIMDDDNAQGLERDCTYPGSADAADKKVKWSDKIAIGARPGTAPSAVRPQASTEDPGMHKHSSAGVDEHEAAQILLGLPEGVDRPGGHASSSSACFTTPMTTGHGTASRRRPRAASARTLQRKSSLSSSGDQRKRGRPSKATPLPDDKGVDTEAGEDSIRNAARPGSAPVRASVRPGLRPTRMRPRSPSPDGSPSPGRKKRRAGQNTQIRLSSPTPQPHAEAVPKDEALLQTRVPRRSRSTEPLWRYLHKCETVSAQGKQTGSGLDTGVDEQAPNPDEVSHRGTNANDVQHQGGAAPEKPGGAGAGTEVQNGRSEGQVEVNTIEEPGHVSEGVCVPVEAADETWQPPQPSIAAALQEQPHCSNKAQDAITVQQLQAPATASDNDGSMNSAPAGRSEAEPLAPEQQPGRDRGPCSSEQGQPSTTDKGGRQGGSPATCAPRAGAKENSQGCANIQPSGAPAVADRKREGLTAVTRAGGAGRPRQGFLSLTAVEEGVTELAAAAVKKLRRLRMCPEGRDEMITHLVVGSHKRTLKVMLAIARGAWLLSAAWLTASLEAGQWQDEEDFQAEVSYSAAAAEARLHFQQKKPSLLKGVSLYIVEPDAQTPQISTRVAALKRTAIAHGAKMTGLRSCSLCIVMHGSRRESGTSSCQVVTEDWLLSLAESFKVPPEGHPYTVTS
ncbi:probable microcephalin at C-terminar half [Coccomyxa sp. Obi]|nr:probable microcephalin at C-terminar half [Coccomyxa sp. Obi]